MFAILDTVSDNYVSFIMGVAANPDSEWTDRLAFALTFKTKPEAETKIRSLMIDQFSNNQKVQLTAVGSENHIIGMHIEVPVVLDPYNETYIDSATLAEYYPEYRFDMTESEYFDLACSYLQEYEMDVVSMDDASIIRTVYAY